MDGQKTSSNKKTKTNGVHPKKLLTGDQAADDDQQRRQPLSTALSLQVRSDFRTPEGTAAKMEHWCSHSDEIESAQKFCLSEVHKLAGGAPARMSCYLHLWTWSCCHWRATSKVIVAEVPSYHK